MTRVAVITGGTRGIGEAVAVALHRAGYAVAASYIAKNRQADDFRQRTAVAIYRWDVADHAQCAAGVRSIERDIGPIDLLVNNAGITRDATLKKMKRGGWNAVVDTNLGGCFNMCQAVWDGMLQRVFGRIVNIGSINGQAGQYGRVNYAAAKSGIHGFTKALAQ